MVLSSSSRNSLSQKIMNCCSICDKQYTHSSSLTHSSKVHTNCNQLSGKSFSKKGRLKIPLTVHSSNKPALSDTADQTVAENLKKESKTHFLQDRVVNVYPSDKENENSYKKRKRCTSVRLVHRCDVCGKAFSGSWKLQRHRRAHERSKEYFCFEDWKLQRPIRRHDRVEAYVCDICNKHFSRKAYIESHISRHLTVHARPRHKCNVCDKDFSQKWYLNNHKLSHEGNSLYLCGICGQHSVSMSALKGHVQLHVNEKPHVCSLCQKSFARKGYLKRHMLIHTGEKRHVCNVCGRKFNHGTHLKTHKLIHTGEKPYSCQLCDKQFYRMYHLRRHMLIHTGDREYGCVTCGKMFAHLSSLTRHIVTQGCHIQGNPSRK